MTIRTIISDGCGEGIEAGVHKGKDLPGGLVVYTEPVRSMQLQSKVAINDTFGVDMNVNVSFGGTPDGIHDGGDSVLWAASALSGTWDFTSAAITGQGGSGEVIDATSTVHNNEALFTRASTISTGAYTAVTGYIYITGWPGSGTKSVEVEIRNGGAIVGNSLAIEGYVNSGILNVWQKFVIPIGDFNIGTQDVDEMVIRTIDIGGGQAPNYYLDTMQFEETGSPAEFTIAPGIGTILKLSRVTLTVAGPFVGTLLNGTMPNLPYNTLLGLAKLPTGIRITLITNQTIQFTTLWQQHIDIMQISGMQMQSGGDGTNTWITYDLILDTPLRLDSRCGDHISYTINDDLSGLLFLRAFAQGSEEMIT